MKAWESWDGLIHGITLICQTLLKKTSSPPHTQSAQIRILEGMFRKSFDSLRAVQLLYGASLPIQAQALIRVLLEARIDVEIFLRLCAEDPVAAARKLLDAMMLQKISQQRQSNFVGLDLVEGAPTPDQLLEDEKLLIERYGKDAIKAMRRHGFSGMSVEDRAEQLGLSEPYNIIYRNFSRNIHNTDYMEHLGPRVTTNPDRWKQYEDLRDHLALSTAIACVWRTAWFIDSLLGGELVDQLIECWRECTTFEHWVPVPKLMEGSP